MEQAAAVKIPTERRRRITRKQKQLVNAVVENPDATLDELGQQADYENRANVHRALKSHNVRARISEMIEADPRLRRLSLIDKLAEGLEAKATNYFPSESGIEIRETADMRVRKGYLELVLRLTGDLDPKRHAEPPTAQVFMGIVTANENDGKSGSIGAKAEVVPAENLSPTNHDGRMWP